MVAKGKIIDLIQKEKVTNVVIKFKSKETNSYITICFSAFSEEIKRLICNLKIEIGDTVKINYFIYSKKFNTEIYFTTATITQIKILEKKDNQLKASLDNYYTQFS